MFPITLSPAVLGALRGLGVAVLTAVLVYVGDVAHLAFLSPTIASLISMVALAIEHSMEAKSGSALFGTVRSK